jgi:MFS family permease
MGVALLGPVLPTLKGVFTVSDAQIGLIFTAYTAPGILLAPFVGFVSDRIGRRRVLVPLLILYGVAGASIVTAETFERLVTLRLLQGIGASSLITLAVTLIGDYYDGRQRGDVVSLNSGVIGVGAAIFPTLGGALVVVHWAAPFAFFAVAILVALVALAVLDEPTVRQSETLSTYLGQFVTVVSDRRILGMYAAAVSTYVLFYGGVLTAIPLLLDSTYGLAAPEIGLLLAMTSIASAAVATQNSRLGERTTVSTLLGAGFLAFGLSFLGIWIADSVAVIGGMLLVFGVGIGLTMPSIDRTLVGRVDGSQRASVLGLESSMIWLGQTIGPVLFPLLATDVLAASGGYVRLFLLLGSVTVGGGILVIVVK